MGTPVVPITLADNCAHWSDPDETPLYVYSMFWDILKGGRAGAVQPPNLRIFKMTQRPTQACVWEYDGGFESFGSQVILDALGSELTLFTDHTPRRFYFVDVDGPSPLTEYAPYSNFNTFCPTTYGCFGFGMVFWLTGVLDIVGFFGLTGDDKLKLEQFPVDSDEFVTKLTSLLLRSNVLIKFSVP